MKLLPKTTFITVFLVWCCLSCQHDTQEPPDTKNATQQAADSTIPPPAAKKDYADESQPEAPDALLYASFERFWSDFFLDKVNQRQWQDLNRIVHQDYGVFAISQTTDLPTLKRFEQLEHIQHEIPEFFAVANSFKRVSLQPAQTGSASLFGPDKPKSYIVEKPDTDLLIRRLEEVESRIEMSCLPADKEVAASLKNYPLRQVVLQDAISELIFARIEGKWYLILWSQLMPERSS